MPTNDDSMPANISQSSWNMTINGTEGSGGRTSVMFTEQATSTLKIIRVWSLVDPQVYVEVGSWDPFHSRITFSILSGSKTCLKFFTVFWLS